QCFAKAASAANGRLVAGERVRLSLDAEPRDRYGRLLAYVYRARDGTFVNAELVREGYARTLTIPPNVRYATRFAGLARRARGGQRGLWRACSASAHEVRARSNRRRWPKPLDRTPARYAAGDVMALRVRQSLADRQRASVEAGW